MPKAALDDLIALLWSEGFKVLGPVARDSGVSFEEVRKISDLPVGNARIAGARPLPARAQASPEKFSAW